MPEGSTGRCKIEVIVPVLNGANSIERTIASIFGQSSYRGIDLTIRVQDGGSQDRTCEVARAQLESFGTSKAAERISWSIDSRKDGGLYAAIDFAIASSGLEASDWITWINAGDTLDPKAFEVVHQIGTRCPKTNWITGAVRACLADGTLLEVQNPLSAALLRMGLADGEHLFYLQQEGTFFRFGPYRSIRRSLFAGFQAAGDYFLWNELAHRAGALVYSEKPLGTWYQHEGQLSDRLRGVYENERD